MNAKLNKALQKLKDGEFLSTRNCIICESPIGFVYYKNQVCFDSNCNCVTYRVEPQPSPVEHLEKFVENDKIAFMWGLTNDTD